MGKGRKPIPTELKRLVGNPGKRKLNERQPVFGATLPPCPDWLSEDARAMWGRVVRELHAAGVLSAADEGVLTGYCVAYGLLVMGMRDVAERGATVQGERAEKPNPSVTLVNSAMTQLRGYGAELGLSPVARQRLQSPTRDEDEFETWSKTAG